MVYKSSFLFFSITLAAAAAGLQTSGQRWGDFTWAMQVESRAGLASLDYDAKFIRAQAKSAPTVLKMLWLDVRADLKEIKADAKVETKVAAQRLSRHVDNQ